MTGRPFLDVDTHERLVKLFADPSRRAHILGRKIHLLSESRHAGNAGIPCISVLAGLTGQFPTGASTDAGRGACGGISVNAELLEEYVTGAVLGALESPRVQDAVQAGEDTGAPRRAELLTEIRNAQERREEARRDYAEGTIDKEDWLDIRQRTEARITRARQEYDRLTGSATVFGDIPATEMVRDAWEEWNTDRKRAAIKAVLHKVVVNPQKTAYNKFVREPALRREFLPQTIRARTEFDWRY